MGRPQHLGNSKNLRRKEMRGRRIIQNLFVGFMLAVSCSAAAAQQQKTLAVDPSQSKVQFTVDSTLHTVHGVFQLKSGSIQFDPAGGVASGQLVVDAASGDSDSKSRDHKMTKDILEADKYPEIIFTLQQMKGTLAPQGSSQIQLQGVMMLHGQNHPMTLDVTAQVQGNSVLADTSFLIPYIQWGLKNPSALFLRVSDKVQIHIHAVGQLKASAGSTPGPSASHR
jgi:polyisoprenoid-binding protein YceI